MGTHPENESRKACKTSGKCSNWRQRHGATKEEDRPQGFEHGRQKAPESAEKALDQPHPGIEEVNMFRDDGSVIHFTNPKVQASPQANTFAISGQAETKQVSEMLPSIVNQLGPEGFASLRKLAMEKVGEESQATQAAKDDDVPDLEGDFEEASKQEEQAAKNEDAGTSEAAE